MSTQEELLCALALSALTVPSFGGAFLGTETDPPTRVARIVHPNDYMGVGGVVGITVCIDPNSPFSNEMVAPLARAVETWNAMIPTNENIAVPTSVPANHRDFESAVLHELGHCALGLGHTNEPLLDIFLSNFTSATPGPNGTSNQDNGTDGIQGSFDDERADDINLVWFRTADNNPFTIGATVDSTTYSRLIADLPAGPKSNYAQNANRTVANDIFSFPNGRAVMFSSRDVTEETRTLGFDDVATIRYGQSGVDEIQGTADDYTIDLAFLGKIPTCQVIVRFEEPLGGGPGERESSQVQISGNHYRLSPLATIRLDPTTSSTWFFGDSPDLTIGLSDGDISVLPGAAITYTVTVQNLGQIAPTGPAEVTTTVPENTVFDAFLSSLAWNCIAPAAGSPCIAPIASLPPGGTPTELTFVVTVDDPLLPTVTEITLEASVTAPGGESTPGDNSALELTPVKLSPDIFADGFESGDTSAWSAVKKP